MRLLGLPAVILMITVFFNVVQGQNLQGYVKTKIGQPIPGVTVHLGNEVLSTTNSEGLFLLPSEYPHKIRLTLIHPDYHSKDIMFNNQDQVFFMQKRDDREELDPIIVTAPSETKSGLIFPSSQVTTAIMEQQSPKSLVDAVNRTPGVFIQSGAINTNRITIRGVGSRTLYGTNKIKAYFNGIPITNGVGETAIDTYDPEDLQSIEIIKGPKSAFYGTNLGGTILLNSRMPSAEGMSLKNSTTVGSFGLLKNSLQSGFSDQRWTLHFNYDHSELDGFRDNGRYNKNAYLLNTDYRLNKKTKISFLFNHSNYIAQIPSSIGKTHFIENPSQAAFTWLKAKGYEADKQILTGISVNHKFSDRFENFTSIFYSYSDHYEPRPFNILDEYTNGIGLRSVFTNRFKFLGRKAVWNFGTELFQDTYRWKTIENLYQANNGKGSLEGSLLSDATENRNNINIFSDITLAPLENLQVQLGVNYNDNAYKTADNFNSGEDSTSASRKFDAIFAPSFNISYRLDGQHQLFANLSYGFNYPSLEEALTPEGVVNPKIKPETGMNYEVGSSSSFFGRKLQVLASYYILDIRNLLVAQRVGDDQYIGRNAGRTLHKGLELTANYQWELTPHFKVVPYLNAAFNWHRFNEFISEDVDYSDKDLTGVPNLTIASGLSLNFYKFSFFINHSYVGEMPMNDANTLYSDAYNLLNLKLDYSGQLLNRINYKVYLGINNLSDSAYASSILINASGFNNSEPRYYYPGDPRNYYGGVALRYQL